MASTDVTVTTTTASVEITKTDQVYVVSRVEETIGLGTGTAVTIVSTDQTGPQG
jgi:hypothetical protein